MARCDYANGRIGGRRARLLGAAGLTELLRRPTSAARIAFLRGTVYAPAARARASHEVAGALAALAIEEARRVGEFLEGRRPRALFRALFAFGHAEALKSILRGLHRGEPPARILALVEATPGLPAAALAELAGQTGLDGVLAELRRRESPFAPALAAAWPAWQEGSSLLPLEVALDRAAVALAGGAAARWGGEDGAVVARSLRRRVDATNAATLLKLEGAGAADTLFIDGGEAIDRRGFAELTSLAAAPLRVALGRRLLARDARLPSAPWALDRLLERRELAALRREARLRPLSLAVALHYLAELRAEIRLVRLVLIGGEIGLEADDLVDLVVTR